MMPSQTISHFFAYISRVRWIRRWGLMRNAIEENVATHSWEVAVLAHALAMIRNSQFGGQLDVNAVAAAALYHDVAEVITGDMPTPVKYHSPAMKAAFGVIEHQAQAALIALLPAALRPAFEPYLQEQNWSAETRQLVKAADRLSAWLKCQAELGAGNLEFERASQRIQAQLDAEALPEVAYFMAVFAPSYKVSLDHLLEVPGK